MSFVSRSIGEQSPGYSAAQHIRVPRPHLCKIIVRNNPGSSRPAVQGVAFVKYGIPLIHFDSNRRMQPNAPKLPFNKQTKMQSQACDLPVNTGVVEASEY